MASYPHLYFILAPFNRLAAANAAANTWEPDVGRNQTFGTVRLSANGLEPATHTGCATRATEAMKNGILTAFENVPFYKVYAAADGWTWQSALADAGLQNVPGVIGAAGLMGAQSAIDALRDDAEQEPRAVRKGGVSIPRPKKGRGGKP